MIPQTNQPRFRQDLLEKRNSLTPKSRTLADFVLQNPRRAVFMSTRDLAAACEVSEASVVRFVRQLGYSGYPEFIRELRETIDLELTLLDRVEITELNGPDTERLGRIISQEIDNLQQLYASLDMNVIHRVAEVLWDAEAVYCVGSRLSYTVAYYLGWSLSKVRSGVRIMAGSDSTSIDWLTFSPEESAIVILATTRYPNELIRIARMVKRLGRSLVLIADSTGCPVAPLADYVLIAPSRHIPIIGSPAAISCLITCLVHELIGQRSDDVRQHQEILERAYRENDVLFNI
jgi:DNA-binding MurR/RpiR family transcriptional regulator